MTDVNSPAANVQPGHPETAPQRTLGHSIPAEAPQATIVDAPGDEAHLVAMVELLFFAYRDFVAGPDELLAELGFGRAHHRVLHFVNRNPGLRVADLLEILKITKQSLARVLKQLVDEGFVLQATGDSDRRERRLHLTDQGRQLANRLLSLQTNRVAGALAAAGPGAERAAAGFLAGVITPEDRETSAALVRRATSSARRTRREGT